MGQAIITITLLAASLVQAQSTGGLKGKVKVEKGSPAGVAVVVRQGEREVTRVTTNGGGDFSVTGLVPGIYGLTFSQGRIERGRDREDQRQCRQATSLNNLYLTIDEGSIAFIKGSVFGESGRSFRARGLSWRVCSRMAR